MFDLGGVLLEWSPEKILQAVFADPAARDAVRQGAFLHPDWLDLDRGTLLEDDAIDRFSRRCRRSREEMVAFFGQVKRSLRPMRGSVQLLEDLHSEGTPLYCLSNMTEPCARYLMHKHAFFRLFRGIVISAAIRQVKPDPGIYHHALSTFGIRPAETVFIDDRPENVEAARCVGLQAIHFVSSEDCREQLRQLRNGGFADGTSVR
jgi:putative hydrolase of the HAD superfamily